MNSTSSSTADLRRDNELVALAREGDRVALATLLTRHRPAVARQLQRYPLDAAEREDALQDALLQVVRKLSSFRGDAQFSTWLFRVTANAVLMRMRSSRRRRTTSLNEETLEAPNDTVSTPEWCERADTRLQQIQESQRIERVLSSLPEHYRSVVVEHYIERKSLDAIAEAQSTTESAVRSRLHRARTELRKQLLPTTTADGRAA